MADPRSYVLYEPPPRGFHAGRKAAEDTFRILEGCGFVRAPVCRIRFLNWFLSPLSVCLRLLRMEPGSRLAVQYPWHGRALYYMAFSFFISRVIKRRRGLSYTCIVHDVFALKCPPGKMRLRRAWERRLLSSPVFDCFIVHNQAMADFFSSRFGVPAGRMRLLGLFYYLTDFRPKVRLPQTPEVAFAGDFAGGKSAFAYKLDELGGPVRFALWGGHFRQGDVPACARYMGASGPRAMPALVSPCMFGLAWDGPSLDSCSGPLGGYLRFNSPHKASLYIAAGLPLIVWAGSALAPLAEAGGFGFAVSSLFELGQKIAALPPEGYLAMRRAAVAAAAGLSSGACLLRCIRDFP
jgi:hypothetical protein